MNILYLIETLPLGGMTNYTIQLAKLCKEEGANVTIAYMAGEVNAKLELEGLHVVRVKTASDVAALNPDLIHIQLLSDLDMLRGLLSLDVPLIRSFHDYTSTCLRRGKRRWPGDRCQRPLGMSCAAFGCIVMPPQSGHMVQFADLRGKITERDLYRKFDVAIAGSRHMVTMLLANGFDSARVKLIPYFSRFSHVLEAPVIKASGAGITRPVELLFSGMAVKGKGLELLIESLHGVAGRWHLNVFSQGPRLEAAKKLAEKLGLSASITFAGWVAQSAMEEAYRKADLFVLPSIWDDPGPLVGLEAMSFCTPVMGFSVGGIPDYVIDGQTGFLVRDATVKGLRRALRECPQAPEKLPAMGIAGQTLVRKQHTPQVHKAAITQIYHDVLKLHRKAA